MKKVCYIIPILTFILSLVAFPQQVAGQPVTSGLVLDNVEIDVELNKNGTSVVLFQANVTNTGDSLIDVFDIRVDLRDPRIHYTTLDEINVTSQVIAQSNYALIRMTPDTSLNSLTSYQMTMKFSSDMLQENVGICDERDLCLETVIFYVRPLNEYRTLKFVVSLPAHAVLDSESSPLYPRPTHNQTDGLRMSFIWETTQILPGQERVYIIKYGTPNTFVVLVDTGINSILIAAVAALSGAALVLVFERLPGVIRAARVPRVLSNQGMTEHEEKVIRLLSRKGGSCPQREVYEDLGLSQSLASMVLTGLEQRGVIRRFRDGRENVVHLIEE
ncbi:MAG: helix-turn-helix transcriptional regulator [Candidatus Thorarchaeota archaeon]